MKNSDKTFSVFNPYNNKIVGDVSISSSKIVQTLLEKSYKYNCELSEEEKNQILKNRLEKISNNKNTLAELITSESGLSLKHSLHEVDRAISCLDFSIKLIKKL